MGYPSLRVYILQIGLEFPTRLRLQQTLYCELLVLKRLHVLRRHGVVVCNVVWRRVRILENIYRDNIVIVI